MEEDFDYITTQNCDGCGQRRPGVMLHCRGTPVLFLCSNPNCGGHLRFEAVARRDIDAWLTCSPFHSFNLVADAVVEEILEAAGW